MSTANVMKYRHQRKRFADAIEWMEKNYLLLDLKDRKTADDRIKSVGDTMDEHWNTLTDQEKDHEKKRENPDKAIQILRAKEKERAKGAF